MTTHADLQRQAEASSKERDALAELLRTMQREMDVIKDGAMPAVRAAARRVAAADNKLRAAIAANAALFDKPRTHVVAGLKYGMQKAKGKTEWPSDETVCARIRKLVADGTITPEQQELLIKTTESPVVKALEKLDGKVLKRLGVTIKADSDEVLIKTVDGEVDKAVAVFLKSLQKDAAVEVEQ